MLMLVWENSKGDRRKQNKAIAMDLKTTYMSAAILDELDVLLVIRFWVEVVLRL
jgi:hypothetical protein